MTRTASISPAATQKPAADDASPSERSGIIWSTPSELCREQPQADGSPDLQDEAGAKGECGHPQEDAKLGGTRRALSIVAADHRDDPGHDGGSANASARPMEKATKSSGVSDGQLADATELRMPRRRCSPPRAWPSSPAPPPAPPPAT
jgi:hypothetical protein